MLRGLCAGAGAGGPGGAAHLPLSAAGLSASPPPQPSPGGAQTQGVVSLAHSAVWLPTATGSKQLGHVFVLKKLGMGPKVGVWGWPVSGRAVVSTGQLLVSFPSFFLSKLLLGCSLAQ